MCVDANDPLAFSPGPGLPCSLILGQSKDQAPVFRKDGSSYLWVFFLLLLFFHFNFWLPALTLVVRVRACLSVSFISGHHLHRCGFVANTAFPLVSAADQSISRNTWQVISQTFTGKYNIMLWVLRVCFCFFFVLLVFFLLILQSCFFKLLNEFFWLFH